MRRCLAAFTEVGIASPPFISINESEDGRFVVVTSRDAAGTMTDVQMTKSDFSLLLVEALSRFSSR